MNEELQIRITAEIDGLRKELEEAKKQINNLGKEGKAGLGELNEGFQQAGNVSKKALGIAAGAIAGVTAALLALGPATKDYREGQAKLKTAFQTAGGSAETAKETYNDLYRVLGDSDVAVEAAGHLAQLTTNQKDLQQWTSICKGVYATFGDSLPIESLTEAANETAKTGEITGALADALNWAGVSEDEFAEQLFWANSEAEREALIRNTLNGLYSDASEAYETNAASVLAQNEAQAQLTEALAVLGEAMAPIMTMLTELGAEILAEITPHIQEFAEKNLPAVKDALSKVAEAIGNVIKWIVDHWEFVSTLAAIILAIAAAISVVSTVMAVVNAVMLASPVTWIVLAIVAAIAALTAAIILCIKYWDQIKATVSNVVNAIWNWIKGLVDKIGNAFTKMGDGIKKVWNNIVNFFSGIVTKIKDLFSKVASAVGNAITNTVKKAINGVLSTAVKIINGFIKAINVAIGVINAIPGVNINKLNELQVPQLARGGVLKKGQVGLLEGSGAEAVVPLEKNTEWLDRIAERLITAMGGSGNDKPIILQVDGKTFAKTAVSSINNLTRQQGKLSLNLV